MQASGFGMTMSIQCSSVQGDTGANPTTHLSQLASESFSGNPLDHKAPSVSKRDRKHRPKISKLASVTRSGQTICVEEKNLGFQAILASLVGTNPRSYRAFQRS